MFKIVNQNYDILSERVILLTTFKQQQKDVSSNSCFGNIENIPLEGIFYSHPQLVISKFFRFCQVLIKIFRNLDDFSLYCASLVCKKWNELIKTEISENEWKSFVNKRWILYKPAINISCWKNIYSQL